MAAVARRKGSANLEVCLPQEVQWKPPLRQAAGTLSATRPHEVRQHFRKIKMRKIIAIIAIALLTSCNNFEKKFYQKIDEGQSNAIQKGFDIFDLSTITDFEWDSVFLVRGNESVPELKEEIDEILSDRRSSIHWEDRRFNGKVDTLFRWQTKDLPVDKDRFYFLTPEKKLVIKEIKSGIFKHKPAFEIKCSCCEVNIHNFPTLRWFSKQECIFILTSNTQEVGTGTVWLKVNCTEFENEENKITEMGSR
jgi:hypothetical protein